MSKSHSTAAPGKNKERWFDVPGYEGLYQLSDRDRLKSLPRPQRSADGRRKWLTPERILTFVRQKRMGYLVVNLCRDGGQRTFRLHQLKLMVFVGPCPEGMVACHNDGDTSNNDISNLRWGTVSSNVQDCIRHGTHVGHGKGTEHPHCKLTVSEVLEVRRRARNGERPCDLSRELGLDEGHIRAIRDGKIWKHV